MDIYVVVIESHGIKCLACDWYGDPWEEERQEVFLTYEHAKEVADNEIMYAGKCVSIHKFEV